MAYEFEEMYESHVEGLKVRPDGQATGICPFHPDSNPSFGVNVETGLWLCRAECGKGNAYQFLARIQEKGLDNTREEIKIDTDSAVDRPSKVVATYPYRDEHGKTLYAVERLKPKRFRFKRPDGNGEWIWNLDGVRRIPFRLRSLLKAVKNGKTIFIPEGEKDVDNLRAAGLAATCNPCGAEQWRDEYSDHLKGADVVILPDNDDKGRKHLEQVARSLVGKAKTIKVLTLNGLPPKGDVSDWLETEGTAEQLMKLAAKASPWSPPAGSTTAPGVSAGGGFRPVRMIDLIDGFKNGDGLNPVWIWEGYIPKGALVMLAGAPKEGKTTLTAQLVAAIRWGKPFLGLDTKKSKTLWLGLEERPQDVARRFDALNTRGNIRFWGGAFRATPQNIQELERYNKEEGIELVVIDTLSKVWQVQDENAAAQVERALDGLLQLTRRSGVAILLLHHLRKSPGDSGQDIRGSSAINGLMDMSIVMRKAKEGDATRTLTSHSRYPETPEKLTVALRAGKYQVVAEEEASLKRDTSILGALESGSMLTALQVAQKITEPESSVRRGLERLAKSGRLVSEGKGKQGDGKRYGLPNTTTTLKPIGGGDKPFKLTITPRTMN